MRRGEVFEYEPVLSRPGVSRKRLVVSADFINDSTNATVLSVHIIDRDLESLLSPAIGDHGWANVMTVESTIRRRLGVLLGTASAEELQAVDAALKAAQSLD